MMVRLQPEIVWLGGASWRVRPLTVAQVQDIEPLLLAEGGSGTVAAAIAILRVALRRDHPEAVAPLDDLEAGAGEIAAALATVLRLGGFLPAVAAPGEARADQTPASTCPRSTSRVRQGPLIL